MRKPWWKAWLTPTRGVSLFVYIIFFLASVWATSQSINGTLEFPQIVTLLLSAGIILAASLFLGMIKSTQANRYLRAEKKKVLIGTFIFLWFLMWMISLFSNVHSFYLVGALDDIQKKELNEVNTKISLLLESTEEVFERMKNALSSDVHTQLVEMKGEITNKGDFGLGSVALRIINKIEKLLETTIEPLDPNGRGYKAQVQLAKDMTDKIIIVLNKRIQDVEEKKERTLAFLANEKLEEIEIELEECIRSYSSKNSTSIKEMLSKAYVVYNKCNQHVQTQLKSPVHGVQYTLELEALPPEVESTQLKHISNGLANAFRGTKYDFSRIIWAFFFALIVDLACFAIVYFGILSEEEN